MEERKLTYEQPELTLKYFLFDGDIATISNVDSSHAGGDDNLIEAPDESDAWWGDGW